ncbi:Crp/Fnr family transcriptional regulator [Parasediminibacterium paludis]|uniref:Crp/Fnr family transcriptional regulator n=1 Tax=Parasediminibacterium paludis TaxID=908966 RepID=A0ABV8Q1D7_9BACT
MSQPKHATPEQARPFLEAFKFFYQINDASANFFMRNTYPISIKKGTMLHKAGDICNHIYFITKGAVRGYVNDNGKEKITWISVENEMVTSIYSYYMQQPSLENMDAIEDCEILSMSHEKLNELYNLEPSVNILVRRILEKYYADAEVRALTSRFSDADTKYEFFLNTYSHLANRIPLTYIASFLGINLETLSRVRAKKRSIKKS